MTGSGIACGLPVIALAVATAAMPASAEEPRDPFTLAELERLEQAIADADHPDRHAVLVGLEPLATRSARGARALLRHVETDDHPMRRAGAFLHRTPTPIEAEIADRAVDLFLDVRRGPASQEAALSLLAGRMHHVPQRALELAAQLRNPRLHGCRRHELLGLLGELGPAGEPLVPLMLRHRLAVGAVERAAVLRTLTLIKTARPEVLQAFADALLSDDDVESRTAAQCLGKGAFGRGAALLMPALACRFVGADESVAEACLAAWQQIIDDCRRPAD